MWNTKSKIMLFSFPLFFHFRLLPSMLCAVTEVQEVWRDTAFPFWKLSRGWARLALWGRTWRWWFREFTPSQCLTALPWPSLNPEFPPGLPQLLLQQKRAKPGTIRQAYNEPPSATFGLSLDVKMQWIIFELLWMFLSHNMNYSFFGQKKTCMLVLLVSDLACFSLVVQCESQWWSYCSQRSKPPQSAHAVSSHMALFDKGHKHF